MCVECSASKTFTGVILLRQRALNFEILAIEKQHLQMYMLISITAVKYLQIAEVNMVPSLEIGIALGKRRHVTFLCYYVSIISPKNKQHN